MIGYIGPKKLRLKDVMPDVYEHKFMYHYEYEYYDEETQSYMPTPEWLYDSDAEAQMHLADKDWERLINEEIGEIDELRDKLVAEEAALSSVTERKLRRRTASQGDTDQNASFSLGVTESDLIDAVARYPKEFDISEIYSGFYDVSQSGSIEECEMMDEDYIIIKDDDEWQWQEITEYHELGTELARIRGLRHRIEHLDAKEKRIRKLLEEHRWLSETIDKRSYHIRFSQDRVNSEGVGGERRFYIDLTEESDGVSKRVYGNSIQELKERLLIEEDNIRRQRGAFPEARDNSDIVRNARERIAELSVAETRHLIDLFELSVFAGEADRNEARKRIFELLELSDRLEESNAGELRRQGYLLSDSRGGAYGARWDNVAFSKYLYAYKDKKGVTFKILCDRIEYSPSNLSKAFAGTHQPNKMTAVKLALAMELPPETMKSFIHSAGHPFPAEEWDDGIIRLLMIDKKKPAEVLEIIMNNEKAARKNL